MKWSQSRICITYKPMTQKDLLDSSCCYFMLSPRSKKIRPIMVPRSWEGCTIPQVASKFQHGTIIYKPFKVKELFVERSKNEN